MDAPDPLDGGAYWREVQRRMAEGGAYDHGSIEGLVADHPMDPAEAANALLERDLREDPK